MSKTKRNRYRKTTIKSSDPSFFGKYPTITVNRYWIPNAYLDAVADVIKAFKHGISFNRAVDQVAALDPKHINRNKLAEHTLKYIANDY